VNTDACISSARIACRIAYRVLLGILFALPLFALGIPVTASAWEWVPSEEEIQNYRRSWNPMSNGPILISGVDISPKGQFHAHPFIFSQISESRYGNQLSTNRQPTNAHLYQIAPQVNFAYGWTDHIETELSLKWLAFWEKDSGKFNNGEGGPWSTNTGLADVSIFIKYRPIVQDPNGWRPSVTTFNQIVLPTEKWYGTEKPSGGFAPLGRLPATRFGSITWTEGIEFRKNLRPFRISGGMFYSYSLPGNEGGVNKYPGDLVNTRLIIEHILDDKNGFGYNLEFVGLHGLTFRADGHEVNAGGINGFTTLGVQPTIQFKFTDAIVGAAGVLVPIAGQNSLAGIFPNFSIYFFGSTTGKPRMR
jgi:hypothetical protein